MNTNVLSCGDNLDILRRYLGIQFIDHSPTGLAGTAWTLQNFASIAALISGLISFVIGIVELRTAGRPPG